MPRTRDDHKYKYDPKILDETTIPEKIVNEGGCPPAQVSVHNGHINTYIDVQKQAHKRAKKASDIVGWMLDDMHRCNNPRHKGKVEEVFVENPDFDQSKPVSDENPFYIKNVRGVYEPTRYKENTVTTFVNNALKGNSDFVKDISEKQERQRQERREEEKLAREEGSSSSYVSSGENNGPLVSLDFEDETTIN